MIPGSMRETAGNFINHVISNPIFPFENQEHIIVDGKVDWCLDWWVTEIGKYFFEGEEAYMRYPIARRLEGCKNFDKKSIRKACLNRINRMEEIDNPVIVVYENCRGFNTVLVKFAGKFDRVYGRIQNEFPEVVKKTSEYLQRTHPEVCVLSGADVVTENYIAFSVDGFEGGA